MSGFVDKRILSFYSITNEIDLGKSARITKGLICKYKEVQGSSSCFWKRCLHVSGIFKLKKMVPSVLGEKSCLLLFSSKELKLLIHPRLEILSASFVKNA